MQSVEEGIAKAEVELVGIKWLKLPPRERTSEANKLSCLFVVVVVVSELKENRSRALKSGPGEYDDRSRRALLRVGGLLSIE